MQEVEFLESTSCICLFDKCMVNHKVIFDYLFKSSYMPV